MILGRFERVLQYTLLGALIEAIYLYNHRKIYKWVLLLSDKINKKDGFEVNVK